MQHKARLVAACITLLSDGLLAFATTSSPEVRQSSNYFDDIKPVLAIHCFRCHTGENPKGGLLLDTRDHALAGGKSGESAIVPGSGNRSALIRRVTSNDSDEQMPLKGARLTESEVALVGQWIDEGAKWPIRDDYWAFQPPKRAPLPNGDAANPIDRFIDAKLAASNLKPVPQADPRTLLRRVYFDLVGVPPTPEEARIYVSDKSPNAYDKLVDRLLADPRYGERWARHWLDLARYAESDGYEDDKVRSHAWRYRDYVIRSLNADKTFDRFVQEQIAGDELWPDDPEARIATGFARLGAWDGMSKEPAQQRQDFLNDATDAVGAAILGVTLGCARCHDHKYDVITQRDYYRVQAFFAGVKREERDLGGALAEPVPVTKAYKFESTELLRLKAQRAEMRQAARQGLEQEYATQSEKKTVDDEAVTKRVEREHPGELAKLNEAIKSLEMTARFREPKIEAVFQGGNPKRIHLLKGGELARPGEEVVPGFIDAMIRPGGIGSLEGKRAELARWLTTPENPLTARALVNRLWQHHFGLGLVATPSDFGRNGKRPSHPELLDWLACQFMREGWSLKQMHRLMMTSAAYRRASSPDALDFAADPENKLLWRMTRRRIEGEAVRDTILSVSGLLNAAMGGPGVYAQLPKGVNVEFPNNDKELSWGDATEEDNHRRSIYLFQRRSLTFPLLEVFDGAPMNQSCSARAQTTVAPQALALFYGEFTRGAASRFAERLRREAGSNSGAQIELAFQLAFTRPPNSVERAAAFKFLGNQAATRRADARAALADFCHVLLNASELIYPD